MFFVYVLHSQRDNRFYIGQTQNLTDRLKRHNEGRVHATKGRTPFSLVYSEQFQTRSEAMLRERFLKSLKGNDAFKRIIGV
jgi:putative endonuclease